MTFLPPYAASLGRILYAEDDADSADIMCILMGRYGYQVAVAGSAEGALALARAGGFDLIILDNWLADETGVELCKSIRAFDPRTPVLFYSGAGLQSDIERAMEAGAQGYLIKPAFDDLQATVERLIREARGVRAAVEKERVSLSALVSRVYVTAKPFHEAGRRYLAEVGSWTPALDEVIATCKEAAGPYEDALLKCRAYLAAKDARDERDEAFLRYVEVARLGLELTMKRISGRL